MISSFAPGIKTLTWLSKEGQINLNKVCDILSSSMEYKTLIPIGNQQNQQQGIQRKVHVSFFSYPLGCGHSVPWGSLSGCDNFISMSPQLRKDSVDKIKASKCCLKTKENQFICPSQRIQMNNLQPNDQTAELHMAMAEMMEEYKGDRNVMQFTTAQDNTYGKQDQMYNYQINNFSYYSTSFFNNIS